MIMKKVLSVLSIIVFTIILMGCEFGGGDKSYKVIVPTGAPSLAIANFIQEKEENVTVDIVSGSEPLTAAFTNADYDIIVAPVNLGLKFYNSVESFKYSFYKPIVGCNFYILSTEVSSIEELDGKSMHAFNKMATPGVMLQTIFGHYDLNVDVTYESSVTVANSLLTAGEAKTILTAEPSKTTLMSKNNYHVIDIAAIWREISGHNYNALQAGVFVKSELKNDRNVKNMLEEMENSIELAYTNPLKLAEAAKAVDDGFAKQTVENLTKAIPNCNFLRHELNKEEVAYYFQKIMDLGMQGSFGGKLPDEGFYY